MADVSTYMHSANGVLCMLTCSVQSQDIMLFFIFSINRKLDEVGEFLNHKARVAHIREFQESLADSKDEVIACEAEMRAKEREQGWHTTKSKAREKQLQDSIDVR